MQDVTGRGVKKFGETIFLPLQVPILEGMFYHQKPKKYKIAKFSPTVWEANSEQKFMIFGQDVLQC